MVCCCVCAAAANHITTIQSERKSKVNIFLDICMHARSDAELNINPEELAYKCKSLGKPERAPHYCAMDVEVSSLRCIHWLSATCTYGTPSVSKFHV